MIGRVVVILRIGHRPERDQRVTTHVGLTARALGAQGMVWKVSQMSPRDGEGPSSARTT
jgi:predicted SpoU family rRNA methylase